MAFTLRGLLGLDASDFEAGAERATKAIGKTGDKLDAVGKKKADPKVTIDDEATPAIADVERQLEEDVPEAARRGGEDAAANLGGMLKKGLGGLGLGTIVAMAISEGFDQQGARAKIQAQFGLINADAEKFAKQGAELYVNGWGEGYEEASKVVAEVNRVFVDGNLELGASVDDISERALAMAETWDLDVGAVLRSTAQLMRNGLAPDAAYALDLMTDGFQNGLDYAGDFLDTIDEYSQHWDAFGLSAEDAFAILKNGTENGQRDTDKLADAVKEMRIRTVDDSAATAEAYAALGLNAAELRAEILAGGDGARTAFATIITALRETEDPYEQNRLAVALIGTQYEDLGPTALESLGSIADGYDDVTGKADELTETLATTEVSFESLKRKAKAQLGEIADGFAIGLDRMATDPSWDSLAGKTTDLKDALAGVVSEGDVRAVWQEYATVLTEAGVSQDDLIERVRSTGVELAETTARSHEMITVTAEQADAAKDAATGERRLADALAEKEKADREARSAADAHTKALKDQAAQVDDLIGKHLRLVGGELAVEDAAFRAADAVDDLTEAEKESGAESDEYARALNDAKDAQLSAAQAAADYEVAQREASGETVTAQQKAEILREQLMAVASTLAPGSPLRAAIEGYANDVASVPETATTDFTANTGTASDELWLYMRKLSEIPRSVETTVRTHYVSTGLGYRADGGPVVAGGTYWVGERGPELVTFGHDGYVHNASESAQIAASGLAVGGSPMTGTVGGGSSGPASVTVQVMIGERELSDIIDHRIEQRDAQRKLIE